MTVIEVKEWIPKEGEIVEVANSHGPEIWEQRRYVGTVLDNNYAVHLCLNGAAYEVFCKIRPLRPTITRAEAESLLNKRIID
jgi:hypothetical protein